MRVQRAKEKREGERRTARSPGANSAVPPRSRRVNVKLKCQLLRATQTPANGIGEPFRQSYQPILKLPRPERVKTATQSENRSDRAIGRSLKQEGTDETRGRVQLKVTSFRSTSRCRPRARRAAYRMSQ